MARISITIILLGLLIMMCGYVGEAPECSYRTEPYTWGEIIRTWLFFLVIAAIGFQAGVESVMRKLGRHL